MTDKPNDPDKKHRPPPKRAPKKKYVTDITTVSISVSPAYDYRRGSKKKKDPKKY